MFILNKTMKKTLVISLFVATALIGLAGCASDQEQTPKPKAEEKPKPVKDTRPKEDRLSVGMTKDEVRAAIGKPKGTSVNSDGEESWNYSDSEKAFIPYYSLSGGKFHHLIVNFDKDGKVKNWSTSAQGMY
jgi:outer membrane protein assembly factor BamE (lipoprotein component of BamABCDE complex)